MRVKILLILVLLFSLSEQHPCAFPTLSRVCIPACGAQQTCCNYLGQQGQLQGTCKGDRRGTGFYCEIKDNRDTVCNYASTAQWCPDTCQGVGGRTSKYYSSGGCPGGYNCITSPGNGFCPYRKTCCPTICHGLSGKTSLHSATGGCPKKYDCISSRGNGVCPMDYTCTLKI